jgi:uncharacterized protein (DUF2141 family)
MTRLFTSIACLLVLTTGQYVGQTFRSAVPGKPKGLPYEVSTLDGVQTPPPQQPSELPKGTGLLMGQVVDAKGTGVEGAVVTLSGGFEQVALQFQARPLPGGARRTLTNADGRFVFFDLPRGSYSLEATKGAYLPGAHGRRRPGGQAQSIVLADGERNTQIKFSMWRYASISGSLSDEAGEALVGISVRTLRRVVESGQARWTGGGTTTTDDRGQFRFDSLTPGEFVVGVFSTQTTTPVSMVEALAAERAIGANEVSTQLIAAGLANVPLSSVRVAGDWAFGSGTQSTMVVPNFQQDGRAFVYPNTFHPSARSIADAQRIVLASGDDRSSVDIRVQLVPTSPVSGVVNGQQGPAAGVPVKLSPDYAAGLAAELALDPAISITDARGRFRFFGVPAGQYALRILALESRLWANQPLTVPESGGADVVVSLRGGAKVSGRIEFDGTRPKPGPALIEKFMVRLEPLDPSGFRSQSAYRAYFDGSGQFTITDVPPGKYYVIFLAFAEDRLAMPGWETKGATLNGADVSTRPMDVQQDVTGVVMTITDHPSELTGTVRDATGRGDAGAAVVLVTTERELWLNPGVANRRMRMVRATEAGVYTMRGIPAGEYFLAAIPDEDAADWQDPKLLDIIARTATRVSIVDDGKKAQDLVTRNVR